MPNDVHCKDCGFLAVWDRQSRSLVEVEAALRAAGKSPDIPGVLYTICETTPVCFVRAQVLCSPCVEELVAQEFLAIVNQPRNCGKFTEWQQGFNPKEHVEMDLSECQLQWQSNQSELTERRHQENLRVVALAARWNVFAIVGTGFLSVLATLGAVWIGYLLQS